MEKSYLGMQFFLQVNSIIFFLSLSIGGFGQSFKLPPLDNTALLQKELSERKPGRPPAFAIQREVNITPFTHGEWKNLNTLEEVWKLEIQSPNALSINLGITEFYLPKNAKMFLKGSNNSKRLGPFSIHDNDFHNEFWSPVIEGESILVELIVPKNKKSDIIFKITSVNHDFAGFYSILSGNCNIDVACDEGLPYQDIVRSVAVYGIQGTNFCTGFLINNTAQDCRPFFMTANHCGITGQNAPSVVVYWNYQNSYCRTGLEENQGKGNGELIVFNSGAILRATYVPSDFTLLELDDPAPAKSFFAGWDISDQPAKNTTICIHHPSTSEKRISLNFDGTQIINYNYGDQLDNNGNHLMVENWELGTTESGSSGAPLFNENKRVVGQLHGGLASCTENLYDAFGWIFKSWTGGGTKQSSLKDWLDPLNLKPSFLDGKEESDCGYNYIQIKSPIDICGNAPFPVDILLTTRFSGRINLSLSGLPEGYSYILNPVFGTPGQNIQIILTPPKNGSSNIFHLNISASDGTNQGTIILPINQFNAVPVSPEPEFEISGLNPLLKWSPTPNATNYQLQVFDADFTILDSIFSDTIIRIPNLKPNKDYLWRIRSLNFCGEGIWKNGETILTPSIYCKNQSNKTSSLPIPDDIDKVLRDTIFIEEEGILEVISKLSIEIAHSYIGDLSAHLISPKGTKISLFNQPGLFTEGYGCPGENLLVILADSAQNNHIDFENTCNFSNIAISGSFQPLQKFSDLSGESMYGTWILEVKDHAFGDEGILLNWSFEYCTAFPVRDLSFSAFPDDLIVCEESELDFIISTNTDLTLLPFPNLTENENLTLNIQSFNLSSSNKEGILRLKGFDSLEIGVFQFGIFFPGIYPLNPFIIFGEKLEFPEKPNLYSDELAGSSPLFRWSNIVEAKKYRLEVSKDSFFNDLILQVNTIDTFFSPINFWEEGNYFWKIIAINDCGDNTSKTEFFQISRPNSISFKENIQI
ncbi:MAG: hypothetical protein RJA52_801, partial [Bacteroidota bacterium]